VALLELRDLHVSFRTREGTVRAVNGVSLALEAGQTIGLVGESGSGKTVLALTMLGLTRAEGTEISGQILLDGVDLLTLPSSKLRTIRGRQIGIVFQDPLSSLHPLNRVGWQITQALRAHENVSKKAARARAVELLRSVGIPSPEIRVDAYPHELSGGMRQRVMIATALALDPDLLIADEPTSALDVTVQSRILALLAQLQKATGMTLLLVSHDLGVIAEHCDEVVVMYAGRVVERGTRSAVIDAPLHPYTRGLLGSTPHVDGTRLGALTPIPGSPPNAAQLPPGCAFHPRCALARQSCAERVPVLSGVGLEHDVACPVTAPVGRAAVDPSS
jgi:oligopeptide/dipeptide ABC transporter ATP-binding protein